MMTKDLAAEAVESVEVTEETEMTVSRVIECDLLVDEELESETDIGSELDLVRLDANVVPIVPFTSKSAKVDVHYVDDPDYRGYVRCNGPDCVLCRVGRKSDQRVLLPVYDPMDKRVKVLSMSKSIRPGSLKPQVVECLKGGKRKVLFIAKPDRARFAVSSRTLTEDMDDGAGIIKAFVERKEKGEIDLASVYEKVSNAVLSEIASVATLLKYRGSGDGDGD